MEKAPNDVSFATESYNSLLHKANQELSQAITDSELPTELWREWLIDYYKSEIYVESVGVWQHLTEAIFHKIASDQIAREQAAAWVQGYFPVENSKAWEHSLAHLIIGTHDTSDANHILGRQTLDRLDYMYSEGYVVDEQDYRRRVLDATLQAKPDLYIKLHEVSDKPHSPQLLAPAMHYRGPNYYARSMPHLITLSYPNISQVENVMVDANGAEKEPDLNNVYNRCCVIIAYNQVYGAIGQSISQVGTAVSEPQLYLNEYWTDDTHTTIGLYDKT